MSDQLELMVKYLIHLQFYSEEEDVLVSRDNKQKLAIPGIASVIAAFEDEFQQRAYLIRKKEYLAFLDEIKERIPFELETVLLNFNRSVSELGSHNLTDELSANFLIGPIRSFLQAREFDACMYDIRRNAIIRLGIDAKVILDDRISDFFSRNDSTVAMLHNLALLKFLTDLYGPKDTQERVNRIFDQYCNELTIKLSEK